MASGRLAARRPLSVSESGARLDAAFQPQPFALLPPRSGGVLLSSGGWRLGGAVVGGTDAARL